MPLDYFVWAIVGESRTFILDTGFDAAMAKKRGRSFITPPGDGLKMIGIDPDGVKDVIISHMHYDHTGNNDLFPKRDLSPAGPRDGVLHRPLHVPPATAPFVRGRRCHRDDRPAVPRPGAVP
jgi:glyoxylase-like metal-dependent hydrolase (beta-lactamase superfamily II)